MNIFTLVIFYQRTYMLYVIDCRFYSIFSTLILIIKQYFKYAVLPEILIFQELYRNFKFLQQQERDNDIQDNNFLCHFLKCGNNSLQIFFDNLN